MIIKRTLRILKAGENMPTNRNDYMYEYAKKNLKRIPLDVQKEKYDEIKAAATAAGKSVNGYIKTAIDLRMESEKQA